MVVVTSAPRYQSKHLMLIHALIPRNWLLLLFHACLVKSQSYAPRCREKLSALLPEAVRPRAIVY